MGFNKHNHENDYLNWYRFHVEKKIYVFSFLICFSFSVNHLVLKDEMLKNNKIYIYDWIDWLNLLIYATVQSFIVAE